MMIRYAFVILFLAFLLPACNQAENDKQDEVEELKEEVMRYHDEAMAQMQTLKKLGNKLYGAQSFPLYESWPDEHKRALGNILNQLGDAEKSMWNWMYAYVEPGEDQTKEEKMEYLNSELKKVKVVHEKMFSSIEKAREFSEKHNIEYADQNQ